MERQRNYRHEDPPPQLLCQSHRPLCSPPPGAPAVHGFLELTLATLSDELRAELTLRRSPWRRWAGLDGCSPKSAPRSWHELGQESPEKPFWGTRPAAWQTTVADDAKSDLTGEHLSTAPDARNAYHTIDHCVTECFVLAAWLLGSFSARVFRFLRHCADALANAPTLPGSSQVWRLDGASGGTGSWGDVGVPATAWADDSQQRDQLSSNDDDSDYDSDEDSGDDFAGVPYVPIGDGTGKPPNALAAPFYPGAYTS